MAHQIPIASAEGMKAPVHAQQKQRQLTFLGLGIQACAVDRGAVFAHHSAELFLAEPQNLGSTTAGLRYQLGIGFGERLLGERSYSRRHRRTRTVFADARIFAQIEHLSNSPGEPGPDCLLINRIAAPWRRGGCSSCGRQIQPFSGKPRRDGADTALAVPRLRLYCLCCRF